MPYPTMGQYNAATYSLAALQTGDVTGYFVGAEAG